VATRWNPYGLLPDGGWQRTPTGFKGEYFNNKELQGEPATVRIDQQIKFDWGRYKPTPQVGENNFSVRWTGKLTPPESGVYRLGITGDDGARLYLDGQLLIDAWSSNPTKTVTKEVNLERGRTYDVRMEYFQNNRGDSEIRLPIHTSWKDRSRKR
jgi:beta-glucosidase